MMSRPTLERHWRQHDRENLQLLHDGTLIFQLVLGVEVLLLLGLALLCRLVFSVVPTGLSADMET